MKQITTVKEFAQEVRALIEKGWTQGQHAQNAYGDSVSYMNEEACRFCFYGAVNRLECAIEENGGSLANAFVDRAKEVIDRRYPGLTPIRFNDHPERTHEQVLEVLDEVIASAA